MNASQIKPLMLTPTATVDNTSATVAEVNTWSGSVQFRQAVFLVYLGTTDIALTALKVRESDTSGSGFSDIAETVFGGVDLPALPSATDDGKWYLIEVSNSKRYLQLVITAGDGSVGAAVTAVCILDNPQLLGLEDVLSAARGLGGEILGA